MDLEGRNVTGAAAMADDLEARAPSGHGVLMRVASLALPARCRCRDQRRVLTRNGDGAASGPLGAVLDLLARGLP